MYVHKHADKMIRLDSDVEQFSKLIMMPCGEDNDGHDYDITIDDILGPRTKGEKWWPSYMTSEGGVGEPIIARMASNEMGR